MSPRSELSFLGSTSTASSDAFGLVLVQVAGGDAALVEVLRRLAWEAYVEAGAPCGTSEDGMAAWWHDRLAAYRN
jgi:hypothetical protein